MAKNLKDTYVCPYLIDIEPSALPRGPLAQFQAKRAIKADTKSLVITLNNALGKDALESARVERSFERCWPELEGVLLSLSKQSSVETSASQQTSEDNGRNVDEIPGPEDFVNSQINAIQKAETAVSLCLHTVSSSNDNWKAKDINAALVLAKEKGVVVRVLAGTGERQFPGASELDKHDIEVCLNREVLSDADLRFLKVDDDLVILGIADPQELYTPSRSWASLKTATLADALEREFLRLREAPTSIDLYKACAESIASVRNRFSAS